MTAADVQAGRASIDASGRLLLASAGPSQKRARQVAAGQAGEDFLGEHHLRCASQGVAYVTKRPTPMRVLGPIEAGKYRGLHAVAFEQAAGVDYVGWLLDGTGRALVAEAKAAKDGRVDLAHRLTPSQREELELASACGAVAALLVVHRRALYAVPWALVRAQLAVSVRHLAAHLVTPGECWPARWAVGGGR